MRTNKMLSVIMDNRAFTKLVEFLEKVPAISGAIGTGAEDDGRWWVKFDIDINHKFAWHTVQELGHVLNYLSLDERLPTSFHPVSPPPYMNGGPEEFLSWVIECHDKDFKPGTCAEWLSGRLPNPVEDLDQWQNE
ncbi:hypothetical protein [Shewanella marisflavi]|uniref:hypothetical protein n=2 Tax=Shewanella marisflavi TaxID=260364 RepID=UPI003AAC465D